MTYYNNVYLPEEFGVYENAGTRRHPKQVLATTTDPITGEEIPDINAPSIDDLTTARNTIAQAEQTISEEPAAVDPNRIPTALFQAVIEYLKAKAAA